MGRVAVLGQANHLGPTQTPVLRATGNESRLKCSDACGRGLNTTALATYG